MNLTPTDKGAAFAGVALASIGWFSLFKLDHVAKVLRVSRFISTKRMFTWITASKSNKMLTLLITEILNFGVHGVTNPASVLFATGSTIVNVFMIFVGLPLKNKFVQEHGPVGIADYKWARSQTA